MHGILSIVIYNIYKLFSILVEKKEYSLFGIRKKQLLILDERKLFIRYSESCNFQLIRQPFPKGENNNETDHSLTYTRATLTFLTALHFPDRVKIPANSRSKKQFQQGWAVGAEGRHKGPIALPRYRTG